jgi:GT2 family glycosyltransferase
VDASVIITNYDTWPLTLRCVEGVNRHCRSGVREILVVDDGSSTPAPSELPANVRVLQNPKNLGYAASVNVGVTAATGDFVLLLDSDACPVMDVIEPLARAFTAEPKLGAVALQTVAEDGSPTQSSQDVPDAMTFLLGPRLDPFYLKVRSVLSEPQRVLYSCALAVRRSAFSELGGFDTGFEFLDADLDFSMRLSEAGWETRLDPSLLAIHEGGGSPQSQSKRVLRCYRNRWRLLEKHGALPAPIALKTVLALRHVAEAEALLFLIGLTHGERRELYREKLRMRWKLFQTVWGGYRDAVL